MNESDKDRFKDLADEVGGQFARDIDVDYRRLQTQFLKDLKTSSEAIIQDSVRRQDQILEELSEQFSGEEIGKPDLSAGTIHLEAEYEKLLKEKSDTDARLKRLLLEKEAADADRQSLEAQMAASENALVLYKEDAEKSTDQLQQKIMGLEEQLGDAVHQADQRGVEKEQTEERLTLIDREKETLDASRQSLEEKVIESEEALNAAKGNAERTADDLQQENIRLENQLSKAVMLADERLQDKEQAEERLEGVVREIRALKAGGVPPGGRDEGSEDPEENIDELRQRIIGLEGELNSAILLADERLVEREQTEERLTLTQREEEAQDASKVSLEEKVFESEKALNIAKEHAEKTADQLQQKIRTLEDQQSRAEQLADQRLREKEQAEERLAVMAREKGALEAAGPSPKASDMAGEDADEISDEFRQRISDLEKQLRDAVRLAAQRLLEKEQAEDRLMLTNRENEALASAGPSREEQIMDAEIAFNRFKADAGKISDDLRAKIYNLEEQLNSAVLLADKRLMEKDTVDERLIRITREKDALYAAGQFPAVPAIESKNAIGAFVDDGGSFPDEFRRSIMALKDQQRDAVLLASRRRLQEEQTGEGLNLIARERGELEAIKSALEQQKEESKKLLIELLRMQRRFQISAGRQ